MEAARTVSGDADRERRATLNAEPNGLIRGVDGCDCFVRCHARIVSAELTIHKWARKRYYYAMPMRWMLKELAAKRGITGYEIAAQTGISRQTIYKLMRTPDATRIDGNTLALLCITLKCDSCDLLVLDAPAKKRR
jgi:DNA-binding Xre family transcriptional regulator